MPMHYDYIFCGYGLSAMIVLQRLHADGVLAGKSVLILDDGRAKERTWCFWESGPGAFDALLTKQWTNAVFADGSALEILKRKYVYKMLEPKTLEAFISRKLAGHNVSFKNESVRDIADNGHYAIVSTNLDAYKAAKVFSSVAPHISGSDKYPLLLQHFRGWIVETPTDKFSEDTATFMDFSVAQKNNTRFVYLLPLSARKALVEYTLFSPELLDEAEYEQGILDYLHSKHIDSFTIERKEQGTIPMTAFPFWKKNTRNVLHIGTAGGWTKPSTGYTLTYAQKQSRRLTEWLSKDKPFSRFHEPSRFYFYDRILVSLLYSNNAAGKSIFSSLFRSVYPPLVLKFLREETTVSEDMRVLWGCPKRLFLKHVFAFVFNLGKK